MNDIFDFLIIYLPYELVHRILFYYGGLQHPVAKLLHQTCPHLETNYSTLLNLDRNNTKIRSCNCQSEILLKWTYPSPVALDLENYRKINTFDYSYPYPPRKKNQRTSVRWIFEGIHKKYIFGNIKLKK